MLEIESLAKKNLVTARPDETVLEAVRRMADEGVGAILVVNGGHLLGIFSERDVVKRVLAKGLDPATTRVADVHTTNPITVTRRTSVKQCAQEVKDRNIRHLPVVGEDGTVYGIVSVRDFLRLVVTELEELFERVTVEHRIQELTDPYSLLDA